MEFKELLFIITLANNLINLKKLIKNLIKLFRLK